MHDEPEDKTKEGTRLNKYIAHCGVTSRRKAAAIVKAGRIKVNGKIETNPSYFVLPGDIVIYKGNKLNPESEKVYILMNKPKDVITSLSDEKGRKTVIDIVLTVC